MNKKTTKRALLLSALSMLLCVSMLVGSTFAWFTDTATTGVNTIQAGNLDIDIVDAKTGESLEGESLGFVKEDGSAITGPILWEPGCRYLLQPAKLVNKGNLWVKYTVKISGYNAPAQGADLAKVIDVYEGEKHIGTLSEVLTGGILVAESTLAPKGETGAIAEFGKLKLVMQETAGNEYMNKSISGVSIKVFATQYTKETDSFNDQYDANAFYPEAMIGNKQFKTFAEAVAAAVDGDTITLTDGTYTMVNTSADITITGTKDAVLSLPRNLACSGATITFDGITIAGDANPDKDKWHTEQLKEATKAVYKNCTIKNLITVYPYSEFESCVFENYAADQYSVFAYNSAKLTDCTFNTPSKAIKLFNEGSSGALTLDVTNCTFNASEIDKAAIEIDSTRLSDPTKYTVNINNCTTNEYYEKLWADKGTKTDVFINGKKYYAPVTAPENVADALQQQDNVTVDVGNDVVISNNTVTVPEGKELTIESGKIDASSNYGIAISAGKDTTITLNDGTYEAFEQAQVINAQSKGAEVIANGGTYEGNYLAFVAADAKVTVTGGTFATAEYPGTVLVVCDDDNNTAVVNISGGTFYADALCNNAVKTNISGGTFYLDALTDYPSLSEHLGGYITITGGTFNVDPSAWVASGYTAVNNNGSWTVQAQ